MVRAIIKTPTERLDAEITEAEWEKLVGPYDRNQFVVLSSAGMETRLNLAYVISATKIER